MSCFVSCDSACIHVFKKAGLRAGLGHIMRVVQQLFTHLFATFTLTIGTSTDGDLIMSMGRELVLNMR